MASPPSPASAITPRLTSLVLTPFPAQTHVYSVLFSEDTTSFMQALQSQTLPKIPYVKNHHLQEALRMSSIRCDPPPPRLFPESHPDLAPGQG